MNILKYITNWKYRYFLKKLKGVDCMIADLEFKRFKTREIREQIRQEYDNLKAKLSVLETQIKQQAEKPTMEKGEIARLDDQKVLLERDIKRKVEGDDGLQIIGMKQLDMQINGLAPSNEYPNGVQGINDQLEALRELGEILKDYIKSL